MDHARDAGYFNNQSLPRNNVSIRDDNIEFMDIAMKPSFDHSYLVAKFDEKRGMNPAQQYVFQSSGKKPSFNEIEVQSTTCVNSNFASPVLGSPNKGEFEPCNSIDEQLVGNPFTSPLHSKPVGIKSESADIETASNETDKVDSPKKDVYKTPNYKNKKRSNLKYMTKHSTSDIKQHEEQMKQKYGVNLSVRKDVVNKTLFRALKRFYTENFERRFNLHKKESSESYMNKINQFCIETFNTKLEAMTVWGVTFDQVEKFMSVMVSPNHIKGSLTSDSDLSLYKDFYSCLYQYSHKKLANMLLSPVCGYLFTDFINSGNLTNFISTCSTMSQHPETYRKAGAHFITIISGKDKKVNRMLKNVIPKY